MPVKVEEFVTTMENLWSQMGNKVSPRFKDLWKTMAETYLHAVAINMNFNKLHINKHEWLVLAPEMGAGKTVGTCVYLGLLARTNKKLKNIDVGAIFCCRTISQYDESVELINRHAGYKAAVACHSQSDIPVSKARDRAVLVITHEALIRSAKDKTMDQLTGMPLGKRCLVIIDEALANVVEFKRVSPRDLHKVLGLIAPEIRQAHPVAIDIIEGMLEFLRQESDASSTSRVQWLQSRSAQFDQLAPLFKSLTDSVFRAEKLKPRERWNDPAQLRAEQHEFERTLAGMVTVLRHWALFVAPSGDPQLRSAVSTIPSLVSPVVLNATARQDPVMDHINARLVPTPRVRSYKNLTLRVLRSKGIGKTAMITRASDRLASLGQFIHEQTQPGDSWLVVVHKAIEAEAAKVLPDGVAIAHWGALDGLNDYRNCNKAVLFGLSYRDPSWSSEMYFALRGVDEEILTTPKGAAIREEIEAKLMASHILQAIGRPRSRLVVDAEGNCPDTTIYVTLPYDRLGLRIEATLREELADVVVSDWDFRLDGSEGPGNSQVAENPRQGFITLLRNSPPGRYPVTDLCRQLGLDQKATKAIKYDLSRKRRLLQEAEVAGWVYEVEGLGQKSKSFLVKSEQPKYGRPLNDL